MASYLAYNNIALDVTRTTMFEQRPVILNGDLIGVRVTIEVEAIYSPGATSFILAEINGLTAAVPAAGNIAPTTAVAIDRFLHVPRAQLVYVIGGVVVIRSPSLGWPVDIDAGPTPELVSVRPGLTERTWRVVFRVSTMISDCNPTTPGLLTNRWTQSHDVGPDHLTTVTTQGISVFRSDVLASLGVTADYFRSICLPPHLYDFKRQYIRVQLNEIGNAMTWVVVDKEVFTSIGATTGRAYGVIDFQGKANFSTPSSGSSVDGIAMPIVIGTFAGVARGDRNSSRAGLFAWLGKFAQERLQIPPPGVNIDELGGPIKVNVIAEEAFDAPVCSLMITARYASSKVQFGQDGSGDPTVNRFLGVDTLPLFAEGQTTGTNPQMPWGARSNYKGMAFSQLLKSSLAVCTPPARALSSVQVPGNGFSDGSGIPGIGQYDYLAGSKPVVEVAVGAPLPAPSTPTRRSSRPDNAGLQEQKSKVSYVTIPNRMVAPVASGEPAEPLVFQLAQPLSARHVEWQTERAGGKPVTPHPASGDPEELAVAADMRFSTPDVGPDMANLIYRAAGATTYLFTGKGTRGPGDVDIAMGSYPWLNTDYGLPSTRQQAEDYLRDQAWTAPPPPEPPTSGGGGKDPATGLPF